MGLLSAFAPPETVDPADRRHVAAVGLIAGFVPLAALVGFPPFRLIAGVGIAAVVANGTTLSGESSYFLAAWSTLGLFVLGPAVAVARAASVPPVVGFSTTVLYGLVGLNWLGSLFGLVVASIRESTRDDRSTEADDGGPESESDQPITRHQDEEYGREADEELEW